jgi:hypothetical protein
MSVSGVSSIVWTPLNEEQCSVRSIYSMAMHSEKLQLVYEIGQVKLLWGKLRSGGRERAGEKGERVRDCVLQRKGLGVGQ